jgi:hypothetical protein
VTSDLQEHGWFFAPERRDAEPLEKLHLARDHEQFFDTPCGGQGFTFIIPIASSSLIAIVSSMR